MLASADYTLLHAFSRSVGKRKVLRASGECRAGEEQAACGGKSVHVMVTYRRFLRDSTAQSIGRLKSGTQQDSGEFCRYGCVTRSATVWIDTSANKRSASEEVASLPHQEAATANTCDHIEWLASPHNWLRAADRCSNNSRQTCEEVIYDSTKKSLLRNVRLNR
jgi:hypothetical protein